MNKRTTDEERLKAEFEVKRIQEEIENRAWDRRLEYRSLRRATFTPEQQDIEKDANLLLMDYCRKPIPSQKIKSKSHMIIRLTIKPSIGSP